MKCNLILVQNVIRDSYEALLHNILTEHKLVRNEIIFAIKGKHYQTWQYSGSHGICILSNRNYVNYFLNEQTCDIKSIFWFVGLGSQRNINCIFQNSVLWNIEIICVWFYHLEILVKSFKIPVFVANFIRTPINSLNKITFADFGFSQFNQLPDLNGMYC